jgi:methyl-accepting chemotaxis protein
MSILEKIKSRPDNQKKIFSLVTAVILTLIIVGLWFSLTSDSDKVAEKNAPSKLSSISPMQVIKDEFSKAFSNFNENMSDLKSTSTVTEEIISEATTTATSTEEISTTSENII